MTTGVLDLVRNSSLTRRLASGGAAGLGARLGKAVLSIGAAAILARILSPSAFGVFFLGQATALFGSVVALLGLENTLIREVAGLASREAPGAIRSVLRRARGLVLLGAGAVSAVLVLGRDPLLGGLFDEPALAAMAGWIALWVALEGLNKVQVSTLRGEHRLAVAAALDGFVQALVFLAAVSGMGVAGRLELETVFMAAALSAGASAATGWWILTATQREGTREVGTAGPSPVDGPSATRLWRRSWPLLGATILAFVITQGDLWLVGIVAASDKAALYGSALKLIFLGALPLFVLDRTVSSTLAEFHSEGRIRELEVLLRGTTTVATAATGLVVLVLLLFGQDLLVLVFGDFYAAATPVLLLLALAQLVVAATGPCGTMLMMAGQERLQLAITAVSGAYLVLGSLWAGFHFGMMGVAAVSASNKAVNNLTTLVLVRRRVGVWSHTFLSPVGARNGLGQMIRLARTSGS